MPTATAEEELQPVFTLRVERFPAEPPGSRREGLPALGVAFALTCSVELLSEC